MRRFILTLALCTLTVAGCGQLGILSSDDVVVVDTLDTTDTSVLTPEEGTYYFRKPGIGTVLQEFYGYSQDNRFFKQWTLELIGYDVTCPGSPCDEIIPLSVDNKWIYEITFFDSLGSQTDVIVDTSYVGRDTTLGAETQYILYAFKTPTAVSVNRSDGYWTRPVDSTVAGNIFSLGSEYLAAKYPATEGDKFDNQTGFESEVLRSDSTITVGAGTFDCYLYLRRFK